MLSVQIKWKFAKRTKYNAIFNYILKFECLNHKKIHIYFNKHKRNL